MSSFPFLDLGVVHSNLSETQSRVVVGTGVGFLLAGVAYGINKRIQRRRRGVVIAATWRFGEHSCRCAAEYLAGKNDTTKTDDRRKSKSPRVGGESLGESDLEETRSHVRAVVEGIAVVEGNSKIRSFVGLGGLPNFDGEMEHDAAVMDGKTLEIGCVIALKHIKHPICVARRVLEQPLLNVIAGEGALQFARAQGFIPENTISSTAICEWEAYHTQRKKSQEALNVFAFLSGGINSDAPFERHPHHTTHHEGATPTTNNNNRNEINSNLSSAHETSQHRGEIGHDTLGVIVRDENGNFAVGMSTSGSAFKHPGRVGDAPLIGSGFYADNSAGAAVATGNGEAIMRTCLSFSVVENLRAGMEVSKACRAALARVRPLPTQQGQAFVSVLAMDVQGNVGAATTISPSHKISPQPDATSNTGYFEYAEFSHGRVTIKHVKGSV